MTFEGFAIKAERERVKGMDICSREMAKVTSLGCAGVFLLEEHKVGVARVWWDRAASGCQAMQGLVILVEFGFYAKPDGSQWKVLTRELEKTGISDATCPQPSLDLPPNPPFSNLN